MKHPRKMHLFTLSLLLLLGFSCSAEKAGESRAIEELKATGKAFSSVARKASAAVVMIKVEKDFVNRPQGSPFGGLLDDELMRRFFDIPAPRRQAPLAGTKKRVEVGQGSGFLISTDGYIVTNNHVIGDADHVKVQLLDGRSFEAKVTGRDPQSDIALIKIDGKNLPYLEFGSSSKLEVGEWVLALGNPFGLSHTLTAGIVSAKGRSGVGINDYEDFIQTDAAINPGNSGGPLVNLDAKVVGMNSAIFSRSGGYMGIGFAIPADMITKIIEQLKDKGSVSRAYLGIYMQEVDKKMAAYFDGKQGVIVTQVEDGSPAAKATLREGDLITSFNDKKITKAADLRNAIALLKPGKAYSVELLREGVALKLAVTLSEREQLAKKAELGLSLLALSPELRRKHSLSDDAQGLLISKVAAGSVAENAGIKVGMLVISVNHKPMNQPRDFNKAINASEDSVLLLVDTGNGRRYLLLPL